MSENCTPLSTVMAGTPFSLAPAGTNARPKLAALLVEGAATEGSHFNLLPRKNAASEVVKKAVAQHCLPLVVLDQSDNGFLLVTYDGQEKWV